MYGFIVGAIVVGDREGDCVVGDCVVGDREGLDVEGEEVGDTDGVVGDIDGGVGDLDGGVGDEVVGLGVGFCEGDELGELEEMVVVGEREGFSVGVAVGETDGCKVGCLVGEKVVGEPDGEKV